jgi:L-2-hydroxycarboxylate dehydrogenase (NAD+)
MQFSVEEFREMCIEAFKVKGFTEEEARVSADEIVDAECRGKGSHGAAILPEIAEWKEETEEIEIEDNGATAFIEGNNNIGSVVAKRGMDEAIQRAEEHGIGMVGVNSKYLFITAGYNPRRAAEKGFIGINWSAASSKVAPHGSKEAVTGTNPIGIGVPSEKTELVLDMAITKTAAAEIRKADRLGEEIEKGVAISPEGEVTTDPEKALDGAMLPFGGYKGSGLGLMIEILGGALVGGKTGKNIDGNRGMVFLAFKPNIFVSEKEFMNRVESLIEEVSNADTRRGFEEVLYPGQRSERNKKEAERTGLEIKEEVISEIEEIIDGKSER